MAFPPDPLDPRTDASPATPDAHAQDHTDERDAINDTVTELVAHEADTTNVHGIADTSALETTSGAQAKADAKVSDTAYAGSWDTVTTVAPSKNAVYDKIQAVISDANALVSDTAYDATSWNGVTTIAPSKNAVRDKIEALSFPQTPWTSNIDADGFNLTGLGNVILGADSDATGLNAGLLLDRTFTESSAGTRAAIVIDDAATFNTTAGGTYVGLNATPVISATANPALVIGLKFDPAISGSSTTTTARGGYFRVAAGASHTVTTGTALYAEVRAALGTLTTGIGVDVASSNALGTFTTCVGLRITSLAGGSTVWGVQVGDYQSFHEGDLRVGAISGGSTAAPGAKLDVIQETIASDTARFSAVATNDDPVERILQFATTTTSNTITTLGSVTVPNSTTMMIHAVVTARRTGGSSGAADDGAGYYLIGTFKGASGTTAQIGTTTATATHESQAGWDCVFDVTGSTARIRVTGATNNNVTWHATCHLFQVGT